MPIKFVQKFGRLKPAFSRRAREIRMRQFVSRMGLKGGERIIDLGGVPQYWLRCPIKLDVTIVNLPGTLPDSIPESHHKLSMIEGDGCDMSRFANEEFDLSFSNSVIEHVGGQANELRFANEIRRLAPAYYVQTPSVYFPIEAHTNMPFWWAYPEAIRERILRKWREQVPGFARMIDGTVVISLETMRSYFPEGQVYTERMFGIPKSYTLYRPANV